MGIIKDLKFGLQVMLKPGENTKKPMEIGQAFNLYYRITIIPLIVLIVFAVVMASAFAGSPLFALLGQSFAGLGASALLASSILIPILVVWVLIPLSIFITGGLYHIVGKWSGQFKNDFNKTFTATMFSKLPTTIFLFTLVVPATAFLFWIFALWELIVLLVALSNQQKVKWNVALGIVLITALVVTAVIGLVFYAFAVSVSNTIISAIIPQIISGGTTGTTPLPLHAV